MRQWASDFSDFLESEQNASPNTRAAYARDLGQWFSFLEREGIQNDEISGEDVYAFIGSLKAREKSHERRSQARKVTGLMPVRA